jgi:molecular chaperone Hsp33
MADNLIRGILGDGVARLFAIDVTGVAEQCRQLHKLRGNAVKLASEAVVASAVLAGQIKGEERVSMQLQCSRPQCAFIGDVDSTGGLRARFTPEVVFISEETGIDGMLLAIKSLPGRELYRGITEIQSEGILSALNRHMGASAQVDNILNISVEISEDGSVAHAGGIFIERLPTEASRELEASAEFVVAFDPVRSMPLAETMQAIQKKMLLGFSVNILKEQPVTWRCSCGQERVEAILASLPVEELTSMLEEDGQAEVICHFCNVAFQVDAARLEQLIVARMPESVN